MPRRYPGELQPRAYTTGDCICCSTLYYGPKGATHPILLSVFFRPMSPMREACLGSVDRRSFRRTSAVDAVRLGLRRLAHETPNARTLYQMPEPARSLTQGELLRPTKEILEG
jgi:hypothetical protein